MRLFLKRVAMNSHGTFGVLLLEDKPFAVTLERPWRQNQRSVSCIPQGQYICLRCSNSPDYNYQDSPKFGNTFQVFNVPDRSKILFHKGNLNDDTHGCILVGENFHMFTGVPGVAASRDAFNEFLNITKHVDEFDLVIENLWYG